ncbi:hypothetical protein Tco_1246445 [Tanacetum coccineum]
MSHLQSRHYWSLLHQSTRKLQQSPQLSRKSLSHRPFMLRVQDWKKRMSEVKKTVLSLMFFGVIRSQVPTAEKLSRNKTMMLFLMFLNETQFNREKICVAWPRVCQDQESEKESKENIKAKRNKDEENKLRCPWIMKLQTRNGESPQGKHDSDDVKPFTDLPGLKFRGKQLQRKTYDDGSSSNGSADNRKEAPQKRYLGGPPGPCNSSTTILVNMIGISLTSDKDEKLAYPYPSSSRSIPNFGLEEYVPSLWAWSTRSVQRMIREEAKTFITAIRKDYRSEDLSSLESFVGE